ncbi:MAG TPA: FAD-binding protein, partial [Nocardioidaceae bacterium]
AEKWERRFPTILASCRAHGIDPVTDLIPVAPACHYASGGVATDLDGRSSVRGLYACGEVACSGVHGANRLASNSLLEGLVFSRRIAAALAKDLPPAQAPAADRRTPGLVPAVVAGEVQHVMTEHAGVLRSDAGLAEGARLLSEIAGTTSDLPGSGPSTSSWRATNLLTIASCVVEAARLRTETRGSHWREDFPATDDADWAGHVDVRMEHGGRLRVEYVPGLAPATTGEPL